jgi:hypothetical protein
LPDDDHLQQLLARHLRDTPAGVPRPRHPPIDPQTMSRVLDVALSVLGVISSLTANLEIAVKLQQDRFHGDNNGPDSGHRDFQTAAPQQIPIEF